MAAQGVARARAEYEDIPQMHFVNKARPAKSQQTFMSWPKKSRKKNSEENQKENNKQEKKTSEKNTNKESEKNQSKLKTDVHRVGSKNE